MQIKFLFAAKELIFTFVNIYYDTRQENSSGITGI